MIQSRTMTNGTLVLEKIMLSHEEKLEVTRKHLRHGGNFEIWLAPYGVVLIFVVVLLSAMFAIQICRKRRKAKKDRRKLDGRSDFDIGESCLENDEMTNGFLSPCDLSNIPRCTNGSKIVVQHKFIPKDQSTSSKAYTEMKQCSSSGLFQSFGGPPAYHDVSAPGENPSFNGSVWLDMPTSDL